MADVICLPGAAAQPVVNPKRRTTPPPNVTKLNELRYRRRRRDDARLRQAAKARESVCGQPERDIAEERLVAKAAGEAILGHVIALVAEPSGLDRLLEAITDAAHQVLREQDGRVQR